MKDDFYYAYISIHTINTIAYLCNDYLGIRSFVYRCGNTSSSPIRKNLLCPLLPLWSENLWRVTNDARTACSSPNPAVHAFPVHANDEKRLDS